MPVWADERWGKALFPVTHPPSATVTPTSGGRGLIKGFGFFEFAFGFAQNDMLIGILRRVRVFGLKKPTKWEYGAMCIGF